MASGLDSGSRESKPIEKIRCLLVGAAKSGKSTVALTYVHGRPPSSAELESSSVNSGYERVATMVDGSPATVCLWWGRAVADGIWTDPSFEAEPIDSAGASGSGHGSMRGVSPGMAVAADVCLICVDINTSKELAQSIAAEWSRRVRSRFPLCSLIMLGTKTDERPSARIARSKDAEAVAALRPSASAPTTTTAPPTADGGTVASPIRSGSSDTPWLLTREQGEEIGRSVSAADGGPIQWCECSAQTRHQLTETFESVVRLARLRRQSADTLRASPPARRCVIS